MADEPENLTLALLREMRGEMATKTDIGAVRSEIADLRSDMKSGFAEVASDLATLEKQTSEKIAGLRRAVVEYHSAV